MPRFICLFLLFSLYAAICRPANAPFIWAEDIPLSNLLPSNEMTDIWQDRNGFIWIGTTNGLARSDGYQMRIFQNRYQDTKQLADNRITCLTETDTHIWVGTSHGLSLINKTTLLTEECPIKALRTAPIKALCSDTCHNVWIASNHLLYELRSGDPRKKAYVFKDTFHKRPININSVYRDRHQQIWICTPEGIYTKKDTSQKFKKLCVKSDFNPITVMEDHDGNYWVGTWGEGLWQIIKTNNGLQRAIYHPVQKSRHTGHEKRFFSLTQDRNGYIWALAYNGLYRFKPDSSGQSLKMEPLPHHINTDKMYTKIITGSDGNLWLSSYDRGTLISFHNDLIMEYPIKEMTFLQDKTPNLLTLNKDQEGHFWFIQDRLGLCVYSPSAPGGKLIIADARDLQATIDSRVSATSHIEKNGVWIASPATGQIILYTLTKNRITRKSVINSPGHMRPAQVIESSNGNLWVRYGASITLLSRNGLQLASTPAAYRFSCMAAFHHGQIIAATPNGLFKLSFANGKLHCTRATPAFPLPADESVMIMGADQLGRVTMATNKGRLISSGIDRQTDNLTAWPDIMKETPVNIITQGNRTAVVTNKRIIISEPDGSGTTSFEALEGQTTVDIFRDKAACNGLDGTFYAGGKGGFAAYHTGKRMPDQENLHHIRLSAVSDIEGYTPQMIMEGKMPTALIGPDTTALTVSLTTAQHDMAPKIRMACRLKGLDQSWIILPRGENTVVYRYLPVGSFILEAKATDQYGRWLPAHELLRVVRQPHWYESAWAMAGYVMMALAVCVASMVAIRRRMEKENRRKLNETLAQARLDYVTGMTHELLTPLNTIACTGEYWNKHFPEEQPTIQILRNNVYRLKQLIQQVLDLRKTDYRKLTVRVAYVNLSAFLRKESEEHFSPMAAQKQIILQISTPENEIWGWADEDKLDKMLYNLVSNAVKYTQPGKHITITLRTRQEETHETAVFTVEDEGTGIDPDETDRIFDRFYTGRQALKGASNGIGLALVRELARLHHGKVGIEHNTPGKGVAFFIAIPVSPSCYSDEEIDKGKDITVPAEHEGKESTGTTPRAQIKTADKAQIPTVLLTDDNNEWLDLAANIMQDQYHIIKAHNAAEAIDVLSHNRTDVIVMDVMMPQTDGWTLCRQIKGDMDYSHIPVIMLTACIQEEDRIRCYEAGADGYISKPFDLKVLMARIDNLIAARQQKQKLFRTEDHLCMGELDYTPSDTLFMQTLADCVNRHLDDEHYGLDALATDLNLSKSTLHRKVKALTGLTPLELIRNIRLKQACRMLARHDCSISEVAYATGFSTPKYFTKCFKEEFGVTPSEYQQDGGVRRNGRNKA